MLHGEGDPLRHRHCPLHRRHVLERLHDDEHVVHADAHQQEGDDGVHVRVEDPEGEAHAVGGEEREADHRHAHHGEGEALLQAVEATEDEADVDEDEAGSGGQDAEVGVDHPVYLVSE